MTATGAVGAASAGPRRETRRPVAASVEQSKKMLQRCWGWDYRSPCIYQITIALADRRSEALGRLVIDCDGEGDPIQVAAHVELTAAGRAVEAEWRRIGELTPAIRPLEIQIQVHIQDGGKSCSAHSAKVRFYN